MTLGALVLAALLLAGCNSSGPDTQEVSTTATQSQLHQTGYIVPPSDRVRPQSDTAALRGQAPLQYKFRERNPATTWGFIPRR